MGLRVLSMRPASIGPVKAMIRATKLEALRRVILAARERGEQSVRPSVMAYLQGAQ